MEKQEIQPDDSLVLYVAFVSFIIGGVFALSTLLLIIEYHIK